MNYWLLKSEAECYSIDDLKRDKRIAWEGVRNFQARNFMRDMKIGDQILFYHSKGTAVEPSGVYGIAKVVSLAHTDESQFSKKKDAKEEKGMDHFDAKATRDKPIWQCVDIAFVKKCKTPVTLADIKIDPKLEGMLVREQGSRLSVMPVSQKHFEHIVKIAES